MFGRKSKPTERRLRANVYMTKRFNLPGDNIFDTALSMVNFLREHPEYDFITDGVHIVSQGDTPGDVVRYWELLSRQIIEFGLLKEGVKNGNWTED